VISRAGGSPWACDGRAEVGESAGDERLASVPRGSTAAEGVGGTLDDAHAKMTAVLGCTGAGGAVVGVGETAGVGWVVPAGECRR
jgi:hypothetical protein